MRPRRCIKELTARALAQHMFALLLANELTREGLMSQGRGTATWMQRISPDIMTTPMRLQRLMIFGSKNNFYKF